VAMLVVDVFDGGEIFGGGSFCGGGERRRVKATTVGEGQKSRQRVSKLGGRGGRGGQCFLAFSRGPALCRIGIVLYTNSIQ
jgi:hypothetical protein